MSDFFGGDQAPALVKALAAALAGRILRLASAQGRPALTWGNVLAVLLVEAPLVGAFGLLGWHAAAVMGLETEDYRVVFTTLLAWGGKEALDALWARILPPLLTRRGGPGAGGGK